MIQGLKIGYEHISKNKADILKAVKENNCLLRQIVRPTLYYTWLIHRFLHPNNKKYENYLFKKTCNLNKIIAVYEREFIRYGNIPVFYHKIHKRHLYGHNQRIVVKDYFTKTSFYWLKRKLESLSDEGFVQKRVQELSSRI